MDNLKYENITGTTYTQQGEPKIRFSFPKADLHANIGDSLYIEGVMLKDDEYVNVETKEVIKKPTKPSDLHFWDWEVKQWVENVELASELVRFDRDKKLNDSDWSQSNDVPTSLKSKFTEYRQALRDIPQQDGFPYKVVWPEQPK